MFMTQLGRTETIDDPVEFAQLITCPDGNTSADVDTYDAENNKLVSCPGQEVITLGRWYPSQS